MERGREYAEVVVIWYIFKYVPEANGQSAQREGKGLHQLELRTGEATTGGQSTCYIPVNSRKAEGINHTRPSFHGCRPLCVLWFCLNCSATQTCLGLGSGPSPPSRNTALSLSLSPADGPPYISPFPRKLGSIEAASNHYN